MNTDILNIENLHKYSHYAMATVFEIYIQHQDEEYSKQAACEAFKEIDKLEEELSRFKPNSEISRINKLKRAEKLVIAEDTFECLKQCMELNKLTRGAFNIAYENFIDFPDDCLILDEQDMSVTMFSDAIKIDLGAFGKGYAVDVVERLLKEWEIDNALIHGGFSSVKAVGAPLGLSGWPVSISNPNKSDQVISKFELKDFSISGSGIKKGIHIINPLTGKPVMNKSGTWALSKSAAVSDALSTAFIVLDNSVIQEICDENEELYALTLAADEIVLKEDVFIAGKPGMINTLV